MTATQDSVFMLEPPSLDDGLQSVDSSLVSGAPCALGWEGGGVELGPLQASMGTAELQVCVCARERVCDGM